LEASEGERKTENIQLSDCFRPIGL